MSTLAKESDKLEVLIMLEETDTVLSVCLYCALGLTLGESALYILFNICILLLEQDGGGF